MPFERIRPAYTFTAQIFVVQRSIDIYKKRYITQSTIRYVPYIPRPRSKLSTIPFSEWNCLSSSNSDVAKGNAEDVAITWPSRKRNSASSPLYSVCNGVHIKSFTLARPSSNCAVRRAYNVARAISITVRVKLALLIV